MEQTTPRTNYYADLDYEGACNGPARGCLKPGHICLVELVFNISEVDRKDGTGKMAFLKATVTSFAGF